MAKTFITAHIKLEDELWQRLGGHANNSDLTTAQLVRRILTEWVEGKVWGRVDEDGKHHTVDQVNQEKLLKAAFDRGWWAFYQENWESGQKCGTPSLDKFKNFMEILDSSNGAYYGVSYEADA